MENFFKLKERGSSVDIELRAALVTFFSMVYILIVNANMFANPFGDGSNPLGVTFGGMYVATALGAIIGCLIMGFVANLPLALASGMGLNAFFVYTICIGAGFSYANALVFILIDGIVFIILSISGLRRIIFYSIPKAIRQAVVIGIGLMIAFLGFKNSGLIALSESTGVTKGTLNVLITSWGEVMPLVVCVAALIFVAVMEYKKVKGSIFIGMIFGTVLYYLLGITVKGFYDHSIINNVVTTSESIRDFVNINFAAVLRDGCDFSAYIAKHGVSSMWISFICVSFVFLMLDMFDTVGTLYATCDVSGLRDKNGNIINMDKALLSDAIATVAGSLCGTNTVTTFVESVTGVSEGGRTGLCPLFVALFFVIAILFAPIGSIIPPCASAVALIFVGYIMCKNVIGIDWTDPLTVVPVFLTVTITCFACDIAAGFAYGMIFYALICLLSGNAKKLNTGAWVVTLMFLVMQMIS